MYNVVKNNYIFFSFIEKFINEFHIIFYKLYHKTNYIKKSSISRASRVEYGVARLDSLVCQVELEFKLNRAPLSWVLTKPISSSSGVVSYHYTSSSDVTKVLCPTGGCLSFSFLLSLLFYPLVWPVWCTTVVDLSFSSCTSSCWCFCVSLLV